jgi:hypothetical protein
MDIKKARKLHARGESVDVGALLDLVEQLQGLLAKSEAKIMELEGKIENLSKHGYNKPNLCDAADYSCDERNPVQTLRADEPGDDKAYLLPRLD